MFLQTNSSTDNVFFIIYLFIAKKKKLSVVFLCLEINYLYYSFPIYFVCVFNYYKVILIYYIYIVKFLCRVVYEIPFSYFKLKQIINLIEFEAIDIYNRYK